MRSVVVAVLVLLSGCFARTRPPSDGDGSDTWITGGQLPGASGPPFLKGQLHVHSAESSDADTPPEDLVEWYAEHGYDFVVVSDHNVIDQPADVGGMLVLPGTELTLSTTDCDPPPLTGMFCMIHVNAMFVDTAERGRHVWDNGLDRRRLSLYERAVDEAKLLGGLPMLNHPGFHFTADEKVAATLGGEGVPLIEVFNQRTGASNRGDASHLSSEEIWDYVLGTGIDMWGVATDDAHHVGDDGPRTADRGWVYVRAERDQESIRDAMQRGDFYSSTGVELSWLEVVDGWLEVAVPSDSERVQFAFIGAGGESLFEAQGTQARFPLSDAIDYVRVVVTNSAGRKAWTQPIR